MGERKRLGFLNASAARLQYHKASFHLRMRFPCTLFLVLLSLTARAESAGVGVVFLKESAAPFDSAAFAASRQISEQLDDDAKAGALTLLPSVFGRIPVVQSRSSSVKLMYRAQRALDGLRFAQATKSLREILDECTDDPLTVDAALFNEALSKLATTLFRLSEEKEAKKLLTDLARQAPDASIPEDAAPFFRLEFDKAKQRVAKLPQYPLSIEGPEDAWVSIDGRLTGMLPLGELRLTKGMHHVRVALTTSEGKTLGFGRSVAMTEPKKITAKLSPITKNKVVTGKVELAQNNTIDDGTFARLVSHAKVTGADYVLVVLLAANAKAEGAPSFYSALFSAKRNAVAALPAVTPASGKLRDWNDALLSQLRTFVGVSEIPHSLTVQPIPVVPTKADDVPLAKATPAPVKAPTPPTSPVDAALVAQSAPKAPLVGDEPAPTVSKPVPTWVWIAGGIGAAAAIGVGGYFVYSAASKPVSGTVTATW
jgi:hypothetical protein